MKGGLYRRRGDKIEEIIPPKNMKMKGDKVLRDGDNAPPGHQLILKTALGMECIDAKKKRQRKRYKLYPDRGRVSWKDYGKDWKSGLVELPSIKIRKERNLVKFQKDCKKSEISERL